MILDMPLQEQQRYADRRTRKQRQRAREMGRPGGLTGKAWRWALFYWREHCAYCGRPASEAGQMTIDHFYPLADPDSPGSVRRNCLPACYECNQAKQDAEPVEWIIDTFGEHAPAILARIQDYFESGYKIEVQHEETTNPA